MDSGRPSGGAPGDTRKAALELVRWAADYYHHPIGEVIASALPKALRLGAPLRLQREEWQLSEAGAVAHAEASDRLRTRARRFVMGRPGAQPT